MNKRLVGVAAAIGGFCLISFVVQPQLHSADAQTSSATHVQLSDMYQTVVDQTSTIQQVTASVQTTSSQAASMGSAVAGQIGSVSAAIAANVTAVEHSCQGAVAQYNQAAKSARSNLGSLPASIDPANPATSCSAR
jgi:hypothetical protein